MTLFTALLLSFQCLFRHPTIIGAGVPLPRGWGLRGRILPRSGGTRVERLHEAQRCWPHLSLLGNGSARTLFSLCGSKAASRPSPSLLPLEFVELAPGGLRAASSGAGVVGATFRAAARMSQQSHGQPRRQGTESHLLQGQAPRQRTPSGQGRRGGSFKAGQGRGRTPSFLQGSNSCICRWLSAPSRGRTSALPAAKTDLSTGPGAAFSSQV